MESLVGPLLPLFERERTANRAVALAVVIHTAGSTYRKPGALMLIAHDGSYAGLLSGGCLETDLREHAHTVIETGKPHTVTYDTGGTDDALWGLGVGCEGSMRIFLLRVGPDNEWQPLVHLARALTAHTPAAVAIVVESGNLAFPSGSVVLPHEEAATQTSRSARTDDPSALGEPVQRLLSDTTRTGKAAWFSAGTATGGATSHSWTAASTVAAPGADSLHVFAFALALPPRLLLLGAGPDASPIVDLAVRLGWKVTVYDHRPAYAQPAHFPGAERVTLGHVDELARALELSTFDAAVVMSHHLTSDLQYLRVLAASPLPYVGLLGPANRRDKLLGDLGEPANALLGRLHAPVGLALGGRSPEAIALAIVAEIHAYLHGRESGPFSATVAYTHTGTGSNPA